jgi:hypothetical protein
MRKKTGLRTRKHPGSGAEARKERLIAKEEENTPQSVQETYVLDNRSHRTMES